jgi:L,D-peptidoglycan transpeptidase YkuD (ErfK/YbiS/YcfS/YnhG family)
VRGAIVALAVLSFTARAAGNDSTPEASPEPSPIPLATRQLVIVRAGSWKSTTGTLQRYERSGGGSWQPTALSISVNLGRNGLAWGRGLQVSQESGPQKTEGDQKSPAGAFVLGSAFGYQNDLPDGARKYPYVHVRAGIACIEDKKSKYYNQVIDTRETAADWRRRDDMKRADGLFRWGIVVEHNTTDTRPGAGSCIFLHIWRGQGKGTAGCTSMAPGAIEETIRWLDPAARPILVQLPESEYVRLRPSWGLP